MSAAEASPTPQEKGRILCDALQRVNVDTFLNLTRVYPEEPRKRFTLRDENDHSDQWEKFIQFPPELSKLFPGSYISPDQFLTTIGKTETKEGDIKKIVSNEISSSSEPTFQFEGEKFHLRIMNEMSNQHALTMSRLAQEVSNKNEYPDGFASDNAEEIRAEYQDAMAKNITQELVKKPLKRPAIRIHDDCLASGDSIISYLFDRIMNSDVELDKLQKRGVNVVIDGAATAQGILYLRAFAESFSIPIEITAGHMAFGLTQGENGKHANYITYPPQSDSAFYSQLDVSERAQIESFGDMGAVAGDMGEAERGIDKDKMQAIRTIRGSDYCPWNDTRTDNHGKHEYSGFGIAIQKKSGDDITDYVYFARGGYLPFAFDMMSILNPHSSLLEKANVIITRLSRLNVTGGEAGVLGFGAGVKKADCVTYLEEK